MSKVLSKKNREWLSDFVFKGEGDAFTLKKMNLDPSNLMTIKSMQLLSIAFKQMKKVMTQNDLQNLFTKKDS
jgi:hypothetical protein